MDLLATIVAMLVQLKTTFILYKISRSDRQIKSMLCNYVKTNRPISTRISIKH